MQSAIKGKAQAKADAAAADQSFYTGKPYLPATGSYAFKYRSYQPELARWTSEDPSGFPDGANNGIYVNNNVSNCYDPDGLRTEYYTRKEIQVKSGFILTQFQNDKNNDFSISSDVSISGPSIKVSYTPTNTQYMILSTKHIDLDPSSSKFDSSPDGDGWKIDVEWQEITNITEERLDYRNQYISDGIYETRYTVSSKIARFQMWSREVE